MALLFPAEKGGEREEDTEIDTPLNIPTAPPGSASFLLEEPSIPTVVVSFSVILIPQVRFPQKASSAYSVGGEGRGSVLVRVFAVSHPGRRQWQEDG